MDSVLDYKKTENPVLHLNYRTILSVALPLMGSSFIQSIVLLTDSAFLSRYSSDSFVASGNAGLIYITVFMAVIGMSDGAQILFARRIGQDRSDALGRIFGTSIISIFLVVCVLFFFVQFLMPQLLLSYSKHPDLAAAQGNFISIRSYALFFGMISLPISAFFLALGKTWVVLLSAIITASSNIFLDAVMIFGELGFPRMGLAGAAWASTLAEGLGMAFLIVFLIYSKERRKYKLLAHFSYNFESIKELFKIGSPIVLQGFLALATWTVFFTWIEQMGKFELTVSQNIRSLYFLAFVPLWGFAGTTKTYISQYIGAGRFDDLKIIKRRIQLLTLIFMLAIFHGAFLYPEWLISKINPDQAYLTKSAEILRFVCPSMFIFGFASVYFQTINGSGNTMITFGIEAISVVIYIISAFLLIKVFTVDIYWAWTVEYIYFITMGALSLIYLRFFNWKKKVL